MAWMDGWMDDQIFRILAEWHNKNGIKELTLTPSVVGLVCVTMWVGTELQFALQEKGKAPLWNWMLMFRPWRLQIMTPATIPTSKNNPVMMPTTVSSIDELKSPVTHKNTLSIY
jgi:hypothetical protein